MAGHLPGGSYSCCTRRHPWAQGPLAQGPRAQGPGPRAQKVVDVCVFCKIQLTMCEYGVPKWGVFEKNGFGLKIESKPRLFSFEWFDFSQTIQNQKINQINQINDIFSENGPQPQNI